MYFDLISCCKGQRQHASKIKIYHFLFSCNHFHVLIVDAWGFMTQIKRTCVKMKYVLFRHTFELSYEKLSFMQLKRKILKIINDIVFFILLRISFYMHIMEIKILYEFNSKSIQHLFYILIWWVRTLNVSSNLHWNVYLSQLF